MHGRLLVERWNAHQPIDLSPNVSRQSATKAIGLDREHACLLRLLAGVDLHEQAGVFVKRAPFPRRARGRAWADRRSRSRRTAQPLRAPCSIATDRSDEARCRHAALSAPAICPRLLHPVLAEAALTCGDRLLDHPSGTVLVTATKLMALGSRAAARAASTISSSTRRRRAGMSTAGVLARIHDAI